MITYHGAAQPPHVLVDPDGLERLRLVTSGAETLTDSPEGWAAVASVVGIAVYVDDCPCSRTDDVDVERVGRT